MSTTAFVFPPLPAGKDALRILTIDPGDFVDPLTCTLVSATFGSKPKYVSLSYTWNSPYEDNANLPTSPESSNKSQQRPKASPHMRSVRTWSAGNNGERSSIHQASIASRKKSIDKAPTPVPPLGINDQLFYVHRNLYLALLHLRSPNHPLSLWVDAICINQEDPLEREAQVALMPFIYKHALSVVAWLGTNKYTKHVDPFRAMSLDWMTGQAHQFAASLTGSVKLYYSPDPDPNTFARIAESSYWSRVWVVQEVCLAIKLVFVYGSKIWRYEDVEQWKALVQAKAEATGQQLEAPQISERIDLNTVFRLLDLRSRRYSNDMKLENLVEQFNANACTELRDRIYGLLGLANDVGASAGDDEAFGSANEGADSRRTIRNDSELPTIKIDYSKSFYDLWADVVEFAYFKAENREERMAEIRNKVPSLSSVPERHLSIVRVASIIQEAFDQNVEDETASTDSSKVRCLPQFTTPTVSEYWNMKIKPGTPVIRALGYNAGRILYVGPDYKSLIASYQAEREWINGWKRVCDRPDDLENLRMINEKYTADIIGYQDSNLARVRDIFAPSVRGWNLATPDSLSSLEVQTAADYAAIFEPLSADGSQDHNPNIALGTNSLIMLVPPAAKAGDVIVRFWDCNAAIVMRYMASQPSPEDTNAPNNSPLMLVGRADAADILGTDSYYRDGIARFAAAVNVDLDLRTLQLITAYTRT